MTPLPPVKKGKPIRLGISELNTSPASYRLDADELVFDRSLGRPRNAVVLPPDWYLIASAIPATVRRSEEHTSELQSQSNLVCRLLLEKKKKVSSISSLMGTIHAWQSHLVV